MKRLTKLEREMLARCAQFVLAGEWPWSQDVKERVMKREGDALESAVKKLEAGNEIVHPVKP